MVFRVKHYTEQIKRMKIARAEFYRNTLKSALYNQLISKSLRFRIMCKLSRLSRKTYIRSKNRCIISNRSRKCYSFLSNVSY